MALCSDHYIGRGATSLPVFLGADEAAATLLSRNEGSIFRVDKQFPGERLPGLSAIRRLNMVKSSDPGQSA
jgi:hypothetical protein